MKKNVFQRVDEMIESRAAYIKELEAKRAESEDDQSRKEKVAAKILESGTVDEYAEAKAESRIAADRVEYYTRKLTETTTASLFDKASRDQYKKDIDAYTDRKTADELARCKAALTEALNAVTECRETLKRADVYYGKIQATENHNNEIMIMTAMIRTLNGEINRAILNDNH